MFIANIWFTQDRIGRYTWTKPADTGRYEMDYILTKCRYCADIDLNHNPVVAKLRVKLKKVRKSQEKEALASRKDAMNYRCEIDTAVVAQKQENTDINRRWEHF